MSNNVLVIGTSGSGKSTSIRTLPPEETFCLNVLNKPLPFKGAQKRYTPLSSDGLTGNYYASDDHAAIMRVIRLVNTKRPEIKYLVIDDFGYFLTNSFMRAALVKGYDKFSMLAKDGWEIIKSINETRSDLICIMMMHAESDQDGRSKPKTIGKLLDEKVCIEGMFSIVLSTIINDGNYQFLTNHNGHLMAKSPMGMFKDALIPNDLKLVADTINDYLNDDVNQ